jgi:quinol monooxygenase YgiN
MANKTVDLIFVFTVKPEDQARYEQTLAQQPAITKNEPYVLGYEIFRRADGSYCQHERYADEAAVRMHVQSTAEQLKVWESITTVTELIALGPLSEEFAQQYPMMKHFLPYAAVAR